jgi:hypothetical protein
MDFHIEIPFHSMLTQQRAQEGCHSDCAVKASNLIMSNIILLLGWQFIFPRNKKVTQVFDFISLYIKKGMPVYLFVP